MLNMASVITLGIAMELIEPATKTSLKEKVRKLRRGYVLSSSDNYGVVCELKFRNKKFIETVYQNGEPQGEKFRPWLEVLQELRNDFWR
jgi:hypothetical protein